ncbi:MAG: substrate-binding domain-containing protein [Gammaproteobacteria bacterium]|nr:substrate-binding domain-containing protein [Gammaproteobacteria bacterium]
MYSRSPSNDRSSSSLRAVVTRLRTVLTAAVAAAALAGGTAAAADPAERADGDALGICADPNNLPFSDRRRNGFENALARLVGDALGRPIEYTWHPQRRGFIRNTLDAGLCDVVMGVPSDYELARTTRPYYRSTYVFVRRSDAGFDVAGLDDPVLRRLRIGVHAVGDDYSSTPGAAALGRRGLIDNMVGYSIYGDYSQPHPPSRLIEAVADGDIDVAIAWGPLAGYFASRQRVPLEIRPVEPRSDGGFPFVFDISMAVRDEDVALRARLDELIETRAADIRALLERYGVPLVEEER